MSYAQKALAINEFGAPRWQTVLTATGQPVGEVVLAQRGLPGPDETWCAPNRDACLMHGWDGRFQSLQERLATACVPSTDKCVVQQQSPGGIFQFVPEAVREDE